MLTITHASLQDIPLIRELTMKVWPQTYTPILGDIQVAYMLEKFYTPEALATQMTDGSQQFIICYSDTEPVAFAAYSPVVSQSAKLHKIYILPGQQGKGIGKFIINHITTQIRPEGATSLTLNVNRYNTSAMAFYEKSGFKQILEEDIDIGGGYFMNDYVLALQL